ncbi:MAG: ScpA family protein [Pelagibacteraceae bacterium]|jgi:segregation and condensation protein A
MQENQAEILTNNFKLQVDNYEGPLDLLLDLAKAQKVDLMQISIVQLADQYINYISELKNNLELAADFLVMAAWLAYLKSRLLLPEDFDDDFSAIKMAEKLKLQLRKLESIRLLSDQLMSRPKLGYEVFMRAMREGIKPINKSEYYVSLYELIKSYADYKRKENFSSINIKKLPVYTMEEAIKMITKMFDRIKDWCDIQTIVPKNFLKSKKLKKSGLSGTFAASLELVREGKLLIKQEQVFEDIFIKSKN